MRSYYTKITIGIFALVRLQHTLLTHGSSEKAHSSEWFFKTKKGQYAAGDQFIGVSVPVQRKIAREFRSLRMSEIKKLLKSPIHEHRLTGLFIMIEQYKKGEDRKRQEIHNTYLQFVDRVNNWDLVDSSAEVCIGWYLRDKDRSLLYEFARSENLWRRRIAMIATFAYIKINDFDDALHIAEILVHDSHDLIQKAVGWMLREIGKRDMETEERFLRTYFKTMPRTMLRYFDRMF